MIDESGKIGIGTSSPGNNLELNQDNDGPVRAAVINKSTGTLQETSFTLESDTVGMDLLLYGSGRAGTMSGFDMNKSAFIRTWGGRPADRLVIATGSSAPIHFSTSDTPRMTIATNGNVGIGTTSPSQKLQVNGNAIIGESGETLKIGNIGHSGWAGIAHTSCANTSDYALIQNSSGATILNSKSGQTLHFRQGNTDKMVLDADGNLGIGTTSGPYDKLHVNGTVRIQQSHKMAHNAQIYVDDGGKGARLVFKLNNSHHGSKTHAIWDGDANWDYSSDASLKTNILKEAGILDRLVQLEVKRYQWKHGEGKDPEKIGFIADEVKPIFPELVGTFSDPDTGEETLTLKYTNFGVLAVGAIKELKAEFDATVANQAKTIKKLQEKVEMLKQKFAN